MLSVKKFSSNQELSPKLRPILRLCRNRTVKMRLMVPDFLDFILCYILANVMNNVVTIQQRGKFFLNVFVRLTVICLGFLNGLLPIL
jgi:hypothetical protein